MESIFEQIKIRKLIFIYIILGLFLALWKLDSQIEYLVVNLAMLIWFLFTLKSRERIAEVYEDFLIKVKWKKTIVTTIVLQLFSIGCLSMLFYFLYQTNPDLITKMLQEAAEQYKTSSTLSTLALHLNVILIGPIIEEIMFRGILLNRLRLRWGINVGILLSSTLFAFMHIEMAFVFAFTFGICMCLLYLRTKNIMITMAVHILNNFSASVFGLVAEKISDDPSSMAITVDTSDLMIGIVLVIPSLFYILKYIKQNWPKETLPLPLPNSG